MALDPAGNLYISHNTPFDCVVRKVAVDGIITTVAGKLIVVTQAMEVLRLVRFSTEQKGS